MSEDVDPWEDPVAVLDERRDWLRAFIAEHGVQTNEVQRSWMLVPCFLEIARRAGVERIDLLELGSSAGLNLVWDRYRSVYDAGAWGPSDAQLELRGEERGRLPEELLRVGIRVRHRRGIDISPIDVTRPEGALLLKSFVWADQTARLERLDRAIETLRGDPPTLEQGDVVERLPAILGERELGALTIVYATAVLAYLGERRGVVRETLARAGREFPLVFLWTGQPSADEHRFWGVWAQFWPEDEKVLLAHAGFHGQWLGWVGGQP